MEYIPFGVASSNRAKGFADEFLHRPCPESCAFSEDLGFTDCLHEVDGHDVARIVSHQSLIESRKQGRGDVNIPGNLQKCRFGCILPTINHPSPHNILNQRLNTPNSVPGPANSKHQLPVYGKRVPTKNRCRQERRLALSEFGNGDAHGVRVDGRTVHEDLIAKFMAGIHS